MNIEIYEPGGGLRGPKHVASHIWIIMVHGEPQAVSESHWLQMGVSPELAERAFHAHWEPCPFTGQEAVHTSSEEAPWHWWIHDLRVNHRYRIRFRCEYCGYHGQVQREPSDLVEREPNHLRKPFIHPEGHKALPQPAPKIREHRSLGFDIPSSSLTVSSEPGTLVIVVRDQTRTVTTGYLKRHFHGLFLLHHEPNGSWAIFEQLPDSPDSEEH